MRETHFESRYAKESLGYLPRDKRDEAKAFMVGEHAENPNDPELALTQSGPGGRWAPNNTKERRLPAVEHIILTHRHLDHVGALPVLLNTLKENGLPPPRIWKLPSPDEVELAASERDRPTADSALIQNLPQGTYHPFSPFQPLHPILPGLMISIIDPTYKHLLKHDKDGKPKWNEVPEIARVSLRCLRTPGHTADSVSLVMREGEKGVFTGDTVLGQGTTIFTDLTACTRSFDRLDTADSFLADLTSIKTLLALKPNILYPALGPHIPTPDRCATFLQDYLTHRQQREDQIISLIRSLFKDPKLLTKSFVEYQEKHDQAKIDVDKYQHEFLSGKPYKPSKEKEKRVKEEMDMVDKVSDKFPEESKGISIPLMCRLLYKTDKEGIIFAAGRSVLAHLEKLEKEGKVKRLRVMLPKMAEGKISDPVKQEGWEWAETDGGKAHVNDKVNKITAD